MKNEIIANLNDPAQLERLYRSDKPAFRQAFNSLSADIRNNNILSFWNARLNFSRDEVSWRTGDLVFVITACLLAGIIAKLPSILHVDQEFFYTRNIGFIIFPILSGYFAWKNRLTTGKIALITGATLLGLIFINSFPDVKKSDTLTLSCAHLLLFLWSVLGFAFAGGGKNVGKRLGYLRYNGDLIVITTLIVIAGVILTGATIGLFSLIGFKIGQFYFDNIVTFLLPAAPIVGSYLTQANPQLVGKISPVIAKIFGPLVLVMLVSYLIAIVWSGKDPYNDREFLLIFNLLLIGVLAIIFFSVAESRTSESTASIWILFLLSLVTIIVDGIALSAIVFRISAWGFTPNRTAVLGSNTLILVNLLLVAVQLFNALSKKTDTSAVARVISLYLPVYALWTVIVTFIFPLIFGFR